MFPHTHCLKAFFYPLPDLICGDSDVLGSESHVLFDNLRYDLIIRILENHACLSADLPEVFLIAGIHSVHPHSSLRGEKQSIEVLGKGRLAGSVMSQDRYELPCLHIEINAVYGALGARHIAFVISFNIVMYQFLYFDHRRLHPC